MGLLELDARTSCALPEDEDDGNETVCKVDPSLSTTTIASSMFRQRLGLVVALAMSVGSPPITDTSGAVWRASSVTVNAVAVFSNFTACTLQADRRALPSENQIIGET